ATALPKRSDVEGTADVDTPTTTPTGAAEAGKDAAEAMADSIVSSHAKAVFKWLELMRSANWDERKQDNLDKDFGAAFRAASQAKLSCTGSFGADASNAAKRALHRVRKSASRLVNDANCKSVEDVLRLNATPQTEADQRANRRRATGSK